MTTDQDFSVEHERAGDSGRYVIFLAPGFEAEMTYRQARPGVIAIDHTFVPPEFRGRNIAERLMNFAIDDARSDGHKIVPICSYVVAQFRRHPEWSDLLAQ